MGVTSGDLRGDGGRRVLIEGASVLTLGEGETIADGAVAVEDGVITAVGPASELKRTAEFDRVHSFGRALLMPGLTNAHFHSDFSLGEEWLQYPFDRGSIHTFQLRAEAREIELATQLRGLELLRSGQTALIDLVYGRPGSPRFGYPAVISGYRALGMRVALAPATRDRNLYVHCRQDEFLDGLPSDLRQELEESALGYSWPVDEVIAAARKVAESFSDDPAVRVLACPEWTSSSSDHLYRANLALADVLGTGVALHALETRIEAQASIVNDGETAGLRLEGLGVLSPTTSLAHFVWATDEDIDALACTGATAVTNPSSNLRLGSGIAPLRRILAQGGAVAFGTDASGLTGRDDLFEEIRLADWLQRPTGGLDDGRLDAAALLHGACVNGSRAAGFGDVSGRLEPGLQADLIALDLDRLEAPAPGGSREAAELVVDRASAAAVSAVFVSGEQVMSDGSSTLVDEDRIREELEGIRADRRRPEEEALTRALADRLDPYLLAHYERIELPEWKPRRRVFDCESIAEGGSR